jgi:hypothetical protein
MSIFDLALKTGLIFLDRQVVVFLQSDVVILIFLFVMFVFSFEYFENLICDCMAWGTSSCFAIRINTRNVQESLSSVDENQFFFIKVVDAVGIEGSLSHHIECAELKDKLLGKCLFEALSWLISVARWGC